MHGTSSAAGALPQTQLSGLISHPRLLLYQGRGEGEKGKGGEERGREEGARSRFEA